MNPAMFEAAAKEKTRVRGSADFFAPRIGGTRPLSSTTQLGWTLCSYEIAPARLVGKYYPYGTDKGGDPASGEKFATYSQDAETGLDYADQRYQQPGTGRFLTPDQLTGKPGNPGSWNKYAYASGDPIGRIDPSGRDDCDIEKPDCYCQIYGDPNGSNGYDPNCDPNYCPLGICGGTGGTAGQTGPTCQQQVVEDVISDRAWQIGNLGSILVNGFSISSSLSTVAGQQVPSGGVAQQTELVLTANTSAAWNSLTTFLNTSGYFSNQSNNLLVGAPHSGYTGNYRQNVLFNSMQIETNPSTADGPNGQITIDIDPFNPAAGYGLGLILHGFGQVLPNLYNSTDTNYAALAQKWGFNVPKCP